MLILRANRRVNTLAFLGYALPLLSLPQPVKHVQFPVLRVPFSLPSTPVLLIPECVNLLLDGFIRPQPFGLLKYIFYYKSFWTVTKNDHVIPILMSDTSSARCFRSINLSSPKPKGLKRYITTRSQSLEFQENM